MLSGGLFRGTHNLGTGPELSYLSYLAALILDPTYPDDCMLYPQLGKLLPYCLVESLDRVSEDQWNATNCF
jgi:hypothetical protein